MKQEKQQKQKRYGDEKRVQKKKPMLGPDLGAVTDGPAGPEGPGTGG